MGDGSAHVASVAGAFGVQIRPLVQFGSGELGDGGGDGRGGGGGGGRGEGGGGDGDGGCGGGGDTQFNATAVVQYRDPGWGSAQMLVTNWLPMA